MKPIAAYLAVLMLAGTSAAHCDVDVVYRDIDTAIAAYKAAPVCCGALNAMTFSPQDQGIGGQPFSTSRADLNGVATKGIIPTGQRAI